MRILRIIVMAMAISIFLIFSVMAATVTINHGGGTLSGTLNSLSVDASGNVTISVNENLTGTTPPPGCTNNAPSINVSSPPVTATVNTPVSATISFSDPDNDTVTVSSNYGTISGTTWSWTPASTGTFNITLTADDNQSCNNKATYSWSISVTSSSGTQDPRGTITLQYNVEKTGISLPRRGTLYFKATLDAPCNTTKSELRIKAIGYTSGAEPDMVVRKSNGGTLAWPTYDDYVRLMNKYGYGAGVQTDGNYFFTNFKQYYGGETLYVNKTYAQYPNFNQADTYYIMLYNNSDTDTIVNMIYWCY